jgi:hypothetical protein
MKKGSNQTQELLKILVIEAEILRGVPDGSKMEIYV